MASPEIRTVEMYRGVVPFIAIQLVGLVLIIVFPEPVTLAGSVRRPREEDGIE